MNIEEIIEEYKKSHPDITELFYDDDIIMCRVQILMEFSDESVRWTIPLEVCPASFNQDQINRLFDTMYNYYHENGATVIMEEDKECARTRGKI